MNILTEVRDYLHQRQHASIDDLALHFDSTPDAIRGMLDLWIARGKIRRCPAAACNSCSSSCPAKPGDSYEWVE